MKTFKSIALSLLLQFFFWLFFFDIFRLVFSIYNYKYLGGINAWEFLGIFWHSLVLDISTICYILTFSFIFLLLQIFFGNKLRIINHVYVLIVLVILTSLFLIETGIYPEWKTKLHYKALLYLLNPQEIIKTIPTKQLVLFFTLLAIFVSLFYWIFIKLISKKFDFKTKLFKTWQNLVFLFVFIIITFSLLFMGIRGGIGQIPVNQSNAYFSKHEILNNISVNPAWNIVNSYLRNYKLLKKNPYEYFDEKLACQTVSQLFNYNKTDTLKLLTVNKPNIVLFILEGWSADLIECQEGEKNITPFFNKLAEKGILFTNIYSSGTRSQEGMAAIFSGFPAQPLTTITQQPEKYAKLPSLSHEFKESGYFTSFYFGGQLTYGNIKSFIIYNGFDKIVDEKALPSDFPRGKLGVHDEYTFPYFLKELNNNKQPFFSAIFTLSTHSPYDFTPVERFTWPVFEKKYVNAVWYADSCLRDFFRNAEKQPWFSNTLFVFISDHSHSSFKNHDFYSGDYHKIVMMITGDCIDSKYKGTKIHKIGSQTDFPAVLLSATGKAYDKFHWSKNLFEASCPEFAFFAFNNGYGFIRPHAELIYDANINQFNRIKIDSACNWSEEELAKQAKSYMQCTFRNYMDF